MGPSLLHASGSLRSTEVAGPHRWGPFRAPTRSGASAGREPESSRIDVPARAFSWENGASNWIEMGPVKRTMAFIVSMVSQMNPPELNSKIFKMSQRQLAIQSLGGDSRIRYKTRHGCVIGDSECHLV